MSFVIESESVPLAVYANKTDRDGPCCWFLVPSWRVRIDDAPVIADLDLRVHKSIVADGIWELSEATTGCRMLRSFSTNALDVVAEFMAGRLSRLTPETMARALARARERDAELQPPRPEFAQ